MSRRSVVWGGIVGLAVAVCLFSAIGVAAAAPAPTLAISEWSYASRTITFSSAYATGTASVALLIDSAEVTRTAVATTGSGSVELPAEMPMKCTVEAAAYAQDGSLIAKSAPLAFDGSKYAPFSVTLPLAQNRILTPSYGFRMATAARVKTATVYLNGKAVWSGPVTITDGGVTLPAVAVRYGKSTARLVGANAWGARSSATVTVYQLGKTLPPYWRYVLVDKSDFYLYYVIGNRVTTRYPIAIGTPWAPTPTGLFRLGYPQPASGVWGPIRMPLQRRVSGGFVRTMYYIHGTNDPSSIGTEASHGCVRMYSSNVLSFAAQLRKYSKRPYTIIRN
jgi:lipoprotein-anchoring transpeptidase ErfK/SrfK